MANENLIPLSEVKKKITAVRQYFSGYPSTDQDKLARSVAKLCMEEVGKIKPVDAVEVVRCKDCKHNEHYDALLYCGHTRGLAGSVAPDSFCSYGERRDNG